MIKKCCAHCVYLTVYQSCGWMPDIKKTVIPRWLYDIFLNSLHRQVSLPEPENVGMFCDAFEARPELRLSNVSGFFERFKSRRK